MTIANVLTALAPKLGVLAPGEVWLAGAGPGDPGLLTLEALAGLLQADVIVHDALVDPRVLALAGPTARLEFAGKRGGRPSPNQQDISTRLIDLARNKLRVLRLKGGDPCIFGRGGDEALALAAANVPFRIIPGVTSGLAALASAAIPATVRGVNHAVILATGHSAPADKEPDWAALARTGQPLVLYMALSRLETITAALLEGGLKSTTPAAVISAATTLEERVLISTLERVPAEVRKAGLEPPAIVAIGEIVSLRHRLLGSAAQ
jgi:uroporphyrin-III C-methyltransferase